MAPTEQELLRAWEDASAQHPLDRALTLLGAAWPAYSHADLAAMSIGVRDSLLLSLREQLFGHALRAIATCPECAEALELSLRTDGLRATPEVAAPARAAEQELEVEGVSVRFRAVDSRDLAATLACADPAAARRVLLERAIVAAHRGGDPIADLPPAVEAQLEERLLELDPQADIVLDQSCPACGARWLAPFDVVPFLWSDVDRWARQLFRMVDTLGRAYGWREADVLALSPRRRRIYLELAGGDA
jgi:hypothetical protein